MKTATLTELRRSLSRVVAMSENGEPVQILNRGKKWALIVPSPGAKELLPVRRVSPVKPKCN